MPDYLKENDKFPEPIITPTTKADNGGTMRIFLVKIFYRKDCLRKKITLF
jgi:phosphoribosylaminoimidazole-succinocarboxamide synthase